MVKTVGRPKSTNIIDYRRTAFDDISGVPFKIDPRTAQDKIRDRRIKTQNNSMGILWDGRFERGEKPIQLVYKTGSTMQTPKVPNRGVEYPLRSRQSRYARGLNMQLDRILESMVNGK